MAGLKKKLPPILIHNKSRRRRHHRFHSRADRKLHQSHSPPSL
ncbi:hypothetical protein AB3S75_030147 [Citrus x aurantiifolia]